MKRKIMPYVHVNGTSREQLVSDYLAIAESLESAMLAIRKIWNARDYYPGGEVAIGLGIAEHKARLAGIESLAAHYRATAEHCDTSGRQSR